MLTTMGASLLLLVTYLITVSAALAPRAAANWYDDFKKHVKCPKDYFATAQEVHLLPNSKTEIGVAACCPNNLANAILDTELGDGKSGPLNTLVCVDASKESFIGTGAPRSPVAVGQTCAEDAVPCVDHPNGCCCSICGN